MTGSWHGARPLLAIAVLGLVLRVGYLLWVPVQPVDDFWSYLARAQTLVTHGEYGPFAGRPDASYPPAYSLLLALAVWGPWPALTAAKLINALLGAVGVLLAGVVAERLAGDRRAGLAAAALAALHPRAVVLASVLASENLFLPLLLLLVALLQRGWEGDPSRARAVGAGVVVGLLTLTRAVAWPLGLLAALAERAAGRDWRSVARQGLLVLAAQHAVLLPWAVRNTVTLGEFALTTSTAGINLYMGNNPEASGGWMWWEPSLRRIEPRLEELGPFEIDALARREAIDWMREHPRRAAGLFLRKLGQMLWHDEGYIVHYALRGVGAAPPEAELPVVAGPHPLLSKSEALRRATLGYHAGTALLGLAGLVLLAWRSRRAPAGAVRATLLFVAASVAGFPLVTAVYAASPRYVWPSYELLLAPAGCALVWIAGRCLNGVRLAAREPDPRR